MGILGPGAVVGMEDDVYAAPDSAFEIQRPPGDDASFSLMRCFNDGGEAFRRDPASGILATIVVVVLLSVAYFVFLAMIGAVAESGEETALLVGFFTLGIGGSLGVYLLYRTLQAGMQILGMNLVRGATRVEDVFHGFTRVGPIWGSALLMYFLQFIFPFILLVLMIGALASSDAISEEIENLESDDASVMIFIVVATVAMLIKLYIDARLLLVFPLILERKAGVFQAVVESWRLTAPQHLWLVLLTFSTEVIFLVGLACCGIGALVTVPLYYAIQGSAAVQLLGKTDSDETNQSDRIDPADPNSEPREPTQSTPVSPPPQDQNPYDNSPYS